MDYLQAWAQPTSWFGNDLSGIFINISSWFLLVSEIFHHIFGLHYFALR